MGNLAQAVGIRRLLQLESAVRASRTGSWEASGHEPSERNHQATPFCENTTEGDAEGCREGIARSNEWQPGRTAARAQDQSDVAVHPDDEDEHADGLAAKVGWWYGRRHTSKASSRWQIRQADSDA